MVAHNFKSLLSVFVVLLLNINLCSYFSHASPDSANSSSHDLASPLKGLKLNGSFDFSNTSVVAYDFGNRFHFLPLAVLLPKTVSDISTTIKYVFDLANNSELTVTARGHGHSLQGQSQNNGGIVISMESLEEQKMYIQTGDLPYVDVSGGELWINILHETVKQGLTPKSWTDYLYLSVGGTLSNAGISGQAFRYGPQINNVYQLEVVTGKGDIVNCSEKENADLFYGVLGGLGQLGIITKARISLEPAPKLVKWIRVLYSNFKLFTKDQEQLISLNNTFDYIQGFVMTGLSSNFSRKNPLQAGPPSRSEGKILYCLEVAKYFNPEDTNTTNQFTENILSSLNYIPHTIFQTDVPYVDFLDRVHLSDLKLKEKDLANVTQPWLIVLVPKSSIQSFAKEVFGNILANTSYNPILIYPFNQSSWKHNTSMVTPAEDIIYLAAFLTSAPSSSSGPDGLDNILTINKRILDFCETAKLGVKQYLPFYETQGEWRAHFGDRWEVFAQRKSTFDPLSILAPGQRIFSRGPVMS
ncbi:cytokinin dehydrogenase 1-like [Chenopodium quinoa]|uniref:cytokinin dehydrogenase n=1 Tax=Chenopodium quinoa TaxID=63459 RepID=A0A803M8B7_CHEQI|nr:cytokinin dehydrogenase 1-like [Chenopodium quinoa]